MMDAAPRPMRAVRHPRPSLGPGRLRRGRVLVPERNESRSVLGRQATADLHIAHGHRLGQTLRPGQQGAAPCRERTGLPSRPANASPGRRDRTRRAPPSPGPASRPCRCAARRQYGSHRLLRTSGLRFADPRGQPTACRFQTGTPGPLPGRALPRAGPGTCSPSRSGHRPPGSASSGSRAARRAARPPPAPPRLPELPARSGIAAARARTSATEVAASGFNCRLNDFVHDLLRVSGRDRARTRRTAPGPARIHRVTTYRQDRPGSPFTQCTAGRYVSCGQAELPVERGCLRVPSRSR